MNLATDLDGTGGDLLLLAYIIGGVLLAVTALLPGSSIGWRIFNGIFGIGMAVWAAYVYLFGGYIIISARVLILPAILIVRAIMSAVKKRKEAAETPAYQPAQGFNGQAPYGAPQGFNGQAPQGFNGQAPQGAPQGQPAYGPPQGQQAPYSGPPAQAPYSGPPAQAPYAAPPAQAPSSAPPAQGPYTAPPAHGQPTV